MEPPDSGCIRQPLIMDSPTRLPLDLDRDSRSDKLDYIRDNHSEDILAGRTWHSWNGDYCLVNK